MITANLSEKDRKRIAGEGIPMEKIEGQMDLFAHPPRPLRLDRPCTAGDGIRVLSDSEKTSFLSLYENRAGSLEAVKFVPASGAASRMFRDWFRDLEDDRFDRSEEGDQFARRLPLYPFHDDLLALAAAKGRTLEDLISGEEYREILELILTEKGLDYAHLPKALLKFHTYPDHNRTSLEEHLVEAAGYVRGAKNRCALHVTVSEEHETLVRNLATRVLSRYESRLDVRYDFSLSIQSPSTNTIAVTLENEPFRDDEGNLLFRPGGHGALLSNLNGIDGDLVFIKNIDNVVPDRLKEETIRYKKILGGFLLRVQDEIFRHLSLLERAGPGEAPLDAAADFCRETLLTDFPAAYAAFTPEKRKSFLVALLNRPIRVCGMVKNEGEPGGGPFWVIDEDGRRTLQIVEEAQIDTSSETQARTWKASTHFNPVDLVCGIRNHRGEKFDLENYVDPKAVIITKKSHEGRDLKALEIPGLWNGGMALWNTLFVEVPGVTFNPVKTVFDLLRPEHR